MQRGHEADVVVAGLLRVKPRTKLQQRGNAAFLKHLPTGGTDGACRDFQQGAFARAVFANEAKRFAGLYLKIHPGQSDMYSVARLTRHPLPKPVLRTAVDHIGFFNAFKADRHGFTRPRPVQTSLSGRTTTPLHPATTPIRPRPRGFPAVPAYAIQCSAPSGPSTLRG